MIQSSKKELGLITRKILIENIWTDLNSNLPEIALFSPANFN